VGMLHGGIPAAAFTSPVCPKEAGVTDFWWLLASKRVMSWI